MQLRIRSLRYVEIRIYVSILFETNFQLCRKSKNYITCLTPPFPHSARRRFLICPSKPFQSSFQYFTLVKGIVLSIVTMIQKVWISAVKFKFCFNVSSNMLSSFFIKIRFGSRVSLIMLPDKHKGDKRSLVLPFFYTFRRWYFIFF